MNHFEYLASAAAKAARERNHASVGTDHLLYVICQTEEGRRQIERMRARYGDIITFLEQTFLSRPSIAGAGSPLNFTEEFQRVISTPVMAARNGKIDTPRIGHLLREMLTQRDVSPITRQALDAGGVTEDTLARASASGFCGEDDEDEDPEKALFDYAKGGAAADGDTGARAGRPGGRSATATSSGTGGIAPGMNEASQDRVSAPQGRPARPAGLPEEDETRERVMKAVEAATRNLSEAAVTGGLDPLIGRDVEMAELIEVLQRRRKANALLIGEPGVGKTAMAEGLATLLVSPDAPESLHDRPVLEVSMADLLSGTRFRGEFEMRMGLLVEMCEALRAILFIDEIHGIVGAGASASAGPDAANILKPALARGGFSVIGATTPNEARRLRSDRALMRRFSEIRLGEPDATETRQIIGRAIGGYESHHGVTYAREALDLAVALADSFLPERRFPDKAFEVLDSAGVVTSSDGREVVDEEDIRRAVARIGGAPVGRGDAREAARLATLGERLQARIFGQDEAVAALVRAARIAHAGVTPGGVAGAYLFNGPTGSGKTALASAFASELGLPLVRIDMSEFMERHSASGLIGAPPGYVGFDRPGRLIEAADTHGRMVLLLDEAEKAHRDVFDILLQLLDYGHVTGGDGRRVSFRGSHVILTANLGAGAEVKAPIGFGRECNAGAAAGEAIASAFRRELLGRIPNRIHFAAPDGDARSRIIRAEVNRVIAHLALGGTTLEVTDEAMAALCSVADPEDGRGLAMLVAREISDRLAVAMIDHPEATAFRIAPGPDSLQAHPA